VKEVKLSEEKRKAENEEKINEMTQCRNEASRRRAKSAENYI
jgi:hypothetical protein